MTSHFIVRKIEEGDRPELFRLADDDVIVGREPEIGYALPSRAVSREHGIFFQWRGHRFFKDLGSTNGTWLNGRKLLREAPALLRTGDVLQIADLGVALQETGPSGKPFCVIVLHHGNFLDEYPVTDAGKVLSIGGERSDLKLDVDVYAHPALVLEKRGDSICALTPGRDVPVFYNGETLAKTVLLTDRDELEVGSYRLIISEAQQAAEPALVLVQDAQAPVDESEQESRRRRPVARTPFGRAFDPSSDEPEVWQTVAIDAEELARQIPGYGLPAGRRRATGASEEQGLPDDAIENKVLLILIILAFLAVCAGIVWWMLL